MLVVGGLSIPRADAAPPASVTELKAEDVPNDDGTALKVSWTLSSDDVVGKEPGVTHYEIERKSEHDFVSIVEGIRTLLASRSFNGFRRRMTTGATETVPAGVDHIVSLNCNPKHVYDFEITAIGADGSRSEVAHLGKCRAVANWFNWTKLSFFLLTAAVCGTVIICTELARRGRPFYVRPIAGLQAIEEAVGRATEMGKPMLFVPGIMDMNEIDTVAGLTVLASVAKIAAEYDTPMEVPTTRSLVMTAAREAVQAAALAAGRPDYYNEDRIYYVTDEQFGYVAHTCGWMYREQPAACFFLGKFFAESLILAETGNVVGAIQIAGTAETTQLPFFVAACDYTLIGEELFAASAYLSGEPAQLGMLKGQDFGKLAAMVLVVVGCLLSTWDSMLPRGQDADGTGLPPRTQFLRDEVLKGG